MKPAAPEGNGDLVDDERKMRRILQIVLEGLDIDSVVVSYQLLDSDGILEMKQLPKHLTVVGAGIIGLEYASIFATLVFSRIFS